MYEDALTIVAISLIAAFVGEGAFRQQISRDAILLHGRNRAV